MTNKKQASAGVRRLIRRIENLASLPSRAAYFAVVKLIRSLPVQARRDIQQEYNLKAGVLRKGLTVRTTNASNGIELRGSGEGISLSEYGFTMRKRDRTVSGVVRKDRGRLILRGAFMGKAQDPNAPKGLHVFRRTGEGKRPMISGRYAGKPREPIRVLYGPSVATTLKDPKRRDRTVSFAQAVLAKEIERLRKRLR